ncbi:MAG TPA: hypothetical protein VGP89_03440 [Candidatus Angelobacter sp.]|jgi:hypothetical protein|nr:hypothetical protein [Candidatus Angelobacter sp.]
MPATSESIGSLVIDLRANVAQLRTDMDAVKETISKSSRETSSQMRADMQETRQVLALMRDDFGIGVPRELRKVIASSELARNAILGLSKAFFGLAFINLGIEVFSKISEHFTKAAEEAKKEAEQTRQIYEAAQKAVEATRARAEALELIGKGEEERHAIQKKHFEERLTQDRIHLASLQSEIAAKIALMNMDLLSSQNSTDPFQQVGDENDRAKDEADFRTAAMKEIQKTMADTNRQIGETQKRIDEAMKGLKESDLQFADFERGLGISRIKNEEAVSTATIGLRKTTAEAGFKAGKLGLDQYLFELKNSQAAEFELKYHALAVEEDILSKDPSRNKEKIEKIESDKLVIKKQHEGEYLNFMALAAEMRKKQIADDVQNEIAGLHLAAELAKSSMLPAGLAAAGTGKPQLHVDMAGAAVDRFRADFKDAAAQGKLLTQAMDDLLTPMDKFRVEQQEIEILKEKFKDYPDAVRALNVELLKANPEFQKLMQASAEFGKDFANELDNLALKGESFHDFLVNIAKDIEEIALKALLLKPLEDFFSGGKSGTGGISGFLGKIFSGLGFAGGGSPPQGQLSVVGENGPELFMPSSAGTIIPNGSFGGVTNYISIDARGAAPGAEAAIIRGLQKALEQNRQQSVAAAIDYQRRR